MNKIRKEKEVTSMQKFPETPPPGDMDRKQRMRRLQRKLIEQGLYVRPVYLDETLSEYGYFIVAVDDPYEITVSQGPGQG